MRVSKRLKVVVVCILLFMLSLGQAAPGYAALSGIICNLTGNNSSGSNVTASVYSDSYNDLQDGLPDVNYAVYRDGSPITGFWYTASPASSTESVYGGYKRDYQFNIKRNDFSVPNGNYSVVTKAVYGSSEVYSDSLNVLADIPERVISGVVSLPEGITAPSGGITATVIAANIDNNVNERVVIPQGSASVSYAVYVPAESGYIVSYNFDSLQYSSVGCYSTTVTTRDWRSATPVDVTESDMTDINMTLLENKIIRGKVSLPSGCVAPSDGIDINVNFSNNSSFSKVYVIIPPGESSVTYETYLSPGPGYIVSYEQHYYPYLSCGIYSVSGTVGDIGSATPIDLSFNDMTNVDLTLIPKRTISGTLALRSGVAPEGGLVFYINAANGNYNDNADITVKIPEGSSSVKYSVYVPEGKDYKVSYHMDYPIYDKYVNYCYYSTKGTVWSSSFATPIDVNGDVTDINLTLIKYESLSGEISLPSGVAPEGGLDFIVYARNGVDIRNTSAHIPQGSSTGIYSMTVPEGTEYVVYYYSFARKYTSYCFYSKFGTVNESTKATPINVTNDVTGINITLIEKKYTISGTISVPSGYYPSGGAFNVFATNENDGDIAEVYIPYNSKSVTYTLYVSGGEYKVNYMSAWDRFYNFGFYNKNGTFPDSNMATIVDASKGNQSNINMMLIPSGATSAGIVTEVNISTTSASVQVGSTIQLNANALPEDATNKVTNWTTSDKNIATVSSTGLVTAISAGEVKIRATSAADESKYEECTITVIAIPPTMISVQKVTIKESTTIKKGETEQLTATITPENATNKGIIWSVVDNDSVVSISSTGLVTALSKGTATVRAASAEGATKFGECIITVTDVSTTEEGKNGSGGGGTGGAGGGGGAAVVPVEIPKPDVPVINSVVKDGEIVTVKANATLDKDTREAKASIDADTINKALDSTKPDGNGIKTLKLAVQKVEGSTIQTVEVPANILSSGNANERFEIVCDAGTATVPSNMLGTNDIKGAKNVALSIGIVDKNKLDSSIQTKIGHGPVIELNITADGKPFKWNNPDVTVTVSIPYTPTEDEKADPEHIVVWYIDDNSEVSSISNGRYDPNTGKVTFSTTHFSKFAVTFVLKTFSDIAGYPWARKPIEVMASKGIISGTSTETYTPDSAVKRGDFMLLLVKTLGLSARFEGNFKDVKPTDYYYDAVGIARKLGIAKGNGDNFNPGEVITRQDMMALIDRAMLAAKKNLSAGSVDDLNKFTDKSEISAYAAKSIASLIKNGVVTGNGTGINPLGIATRAETAVLIYRVYNK